MKNLDLKIRDAIDNKSEFDFLKTFNVYCSEEKELNEFYINTCLDIYNKLKDKQMNYFAKHDALRLTCLYIANDYGIKVK